MMHLTTRLATPLHVLKHAGVVTMVVTVF